MNQVAILSGSTYQLLEIIPGLDDASYKVHAKSSSQEKIALFLELFHGREDMYAKRWYNFKTQKAGYSPACRNEWVRGVCDKKKHRCADCPNREFISLSPEIVRAHLIGRDEFCRDVVGIYPLLPDDGCSRFYYILKLQSVVIQSEFAT